MSPETSPLATTPVHSWSAREMGWPHPRWIALTAALLLAVVLPFAAPDRSWLSVAILGAVWLTLNQSWNLVLGFSGVWHFGQLAIYAIGAYVAALVSLHTNLPVVVSLLLGGVAATAVSVVLSLPALRLRGIYVALMTFGFGEVVRLLIVADGTGLTGGTFGLSGFAGFGFDAVDPLSRDRLTYAIAMGVAVVTGLAIFAIMRSPLGSGLVALRDNPTLAAARGISPRVLQMVVFGISGFFAGIAGAVYAFAFSVVAPTLMGLMPMTLLVTMLVVGGLGTVMGPVVGTVVMAFVQARLQSWPDARLIVLGLILLVMIVAVPRGIVALAGKYRRRLDDWVDADDAADAEIGVDGTRRPAT